MKSLRKMRWPLGTPCIYLRLPILYLEHLRCQQSAKVSSTTGYFNVANPKTAAELESDLSDDEDDDDDSDSDEEEAVAPHDPNSQIRPRLPIYHPGFQLAENVSQRLLETFTQFIVASIRRGYDDEEAQRLRNEIIKKKSINYQDAVRLAVAGDTGVGKSALLNALLGVLNLTIEVCHMQYVLFQRLMNSSE